MNTAEVSSLVNRALNRRGFLKNAGMAGVGVAAVGLAGGSFSSLFGANGGSLSADAAGVSGSVNDSPAEIVTAALVAEDLATTFYFNGLVGEVIQDPNLAGPGGSARNPNPTDSNPGNVNYLQAAMTEEIDHADLMRKLLGGSSATGDPYQTFYFPPGTFDSLARFAAMLDGLENAFIGAYLTATQEFAVMASYPTPPTGFTPAQLAYFAKVTASICSVEAEHRILGRVITNTNPANNLAYEQTDGLTSLFHGAHSAVAALAPFLNPSTGPAYSLTAALSGKNNVALPVKSALPASFVY